MNKKLYRYKREYDRIRAPDTRARIIFQDERSVLYERYELNISTSPHRHMFSVREFFFVYEEVPPKPREAISRWVYLYDGGGYVAISTYTYGSREDAGRACQAHNHTHIDIIEITWKEKL